MLQKYFVNNCQDFLHKYIILLQGQAGLEKNIFLLKEFI